MVAGLFMDRILDNVVRVVGRTDISAVLFLFCFVLFVFCFFLGGGNIYQEIMQQILQVDMSWTADTTCTSDIVFLCYRHCTRIADQPSVHKTFYSSDNGNCNLSLNL